jgi:alpha-glucosidase
VPILQRGIHDVEGMAPSGCPFIKVQQERLFITLWLSGESLPQRVTLRAEEDNEELSLPMQRLRQEPQPGVVAWRGEISLASGQPRRRYSFKLLWADRQLWFTPQGLTVSAGTAGAVCRRSAG